MKEATHRTKQKAHNGAPDELRVVAITCNPAPDAEHRLRRILTILLRHAARDREVEPDGDQHSEALPDDAGVDA